MQQNFTFAQLDTILRHCSFKKKKKKSEYQVSLSQQHFTVSVCLCLLSPFCFKKSTRKGNGEKKEEVLQMYSQLWRGSWQHLNGFEKKHNPPLRCVLCLQILSAATKVQTKSCTIQRGEMVVLCFKVCMYVCVFGCRRKRLKMRFGSEKLRGPHV